MPVDDDDDEAIEPGSAGEKEKLLGKVRVVAWVSPGGKANLSLLLPLVSSQQNGRKSCLCSDRYAIAFT